MEDWQVRNLDSRRVARPTLVEGAAQINHDRVSRVLGTTTYYWSAPALYQGRWRQMA